MLEWISSSPDATRSLGSCVGQLAYTGLLVLLEGELGAGKTCFVQGIGTGLGVEERVKSPSFVLVNEYEGRLPIYHLDLYRLEEDDLFDVGLSEYLEAPGVIIIEWAERACQWYPPRYLRVVIEKINDCPNHRRFSFDAHGLPAQQLVSQMKERMT